MIKTGRIEVGKTPCSCGDPSTTIKEGVCTCGNPACKEARIQNIREAAEKTIKTD